VVLRAAVSNARLLATHPHLLRDLSHHPGAWGSDALSICWQVRSKHRQAQGSRGRETSARQSRSHAIGAAEGRDTINLDVEAKDTTLELRPGYGIRTVGVEKDKGFCRILENHGQLFVQNANSLVQLRHRYPVKTCHIISAMSMCRAHDDTPPQRRADVRVRGLCRGHISHILGVYDTYWVFCRLVKLDKPSWKAMTVCSAIRDRVSSFHD